MRGATLLFLLLAVLSINAGNIESDTAKYNFFTEEEPGNLIEISDKMPENLPSRWGYALFAEPGKVLGLDRYARHELQEDNTFAISGELRYTSQPYDNDHFASTYNYPTLSVGFRYSFNHGTKLQHFPNEYASTLGDIATIYGKFTRPFVRTRKFELAYYIGTGVGYSHKKYNKTDEVNNEFIGSIWDIYFTTGLQATYKIGEEWAILAGIDFSHHSNGALYRPNKGTNYLGPFAGLAYTPSRNKNLYKDEPIVKPVDYTRGPYLELSLGLGAKTLLEDWDKSQFVVGPDHPQYHTKKFSQYGAFSFQSALLYRYSRRWASGISFDVFYSDYADKIARYDYSQGHFDEKHSPWSVGIAAKHEAFYGRFSARMGIGAYVYRHMGYTAREAEGPEWLYEHIGLFYSFPILGKAAVGISIHAHALKADFTELVLSYPIKL